MWRIWLKFEAFLLRLWITLTPACSAFEESHFSLRGVRRIMLTYREHASLGAACSGFWETRSRTKRLPNANVMSGKDAARAQRRPCFLLQLLLNYEKTFFQTSDRPLPCLIRSRLLSWPLTPLKMQTFKLFYLLFMFYSILSQLIESLFGLLLSHFVLITCIISYHVTAVWLFLILQIVRVLRKQSWYWYCNVPSHFLTKWTLQCIITSHIPSFCLANV